MFSFCVWVFVPVMHLSAASPRGMTQTIAMISPRDGGIVPFKVPWFPLVRVFHKVTIPRAFCMKSAWSWDRWAFIGTNSSIFLWIKSRFNSWGLLGIFQYGGIPTPQCLLGNFQDGGAARGPKEIEIRNSAWYIWLYISYLNYSCIVSRKKQTISLVSFKTKTISTNPPPQFSNHKTNSSISPTPGAMSVLNPPVIPHMSPWLPRG